MRDRATKNAARRRRLLPAAAVRGPHPPPPQEVFPATINNNNNNSNRYNVRAVHAELVGHIRHHAWNKFRRRLLLLLLGPAEEEEGGGATGQPPSHLAAVAAADGEGSPLALCRAVVEWRGRPASSGRGKGGDDPNFFSSGSLLHALCHKVRHNASSSQPHNDNRGGCCPVPTDAIETVGRVCPNLWTTALGERRQTPLAVLLERGASLFLVERVLRMEAEERDRNGDDGDDDDDDDTAGNWTQPQSSLHLRDSKGDTPLLFAVKYLKDRPDIAKLLVEEDPTRLSLLLESRKGHIPLYYVVHRELRELDFYLGGATSDGRDNQTDCIPEPLAHMLVETERAIRFARGRAVGGAKSDVAHSVAAHRSSEDDGSDEGSCCGTCDASGGGSLGAEQHRPPTSPVGSIGCVTVLRACLACLEYINEGHRSTLLHLLLRQLRSEDFHTVDAAGNTLLHLACHARGAGSDALLQDDGVVLKVLVAKHRRSPLTPNGRGRTPLHVAIEQHKQWPFLEALARQSPECVQVATGSLGQKQQLQHKMLPLHLMMHQYNTSANTRVYTFGEIEAMWKLFPEAALIPDESTGLFAFQLAATVGEAGSAPALAPPAGGDRRRRRSRQSTDDESGKCDDGDCNRLDEHLSSIYAFLRGGPEVLRIVPSRGAVYSS